MKKYFAYSPAGVFETFDTKQEAKLRAAEIIAEYGDEGIWLEAVDEICWGLVSEVATQTGRVERPDDVDELGYSASLGEKWCFDSDVKYTCDYELKPVDEKEEE